MSEIVTEDELEEIVGDLTECADDALSQAACGGIVDPAEMIAWTEFARRLILYQRDEDILRVEVPELARGLVNLLREVDLPEGETPQSLARAFVKKLSDVRVVLAKDVEAAYQGDPASQSYTEIAVSYPSLQALTVHRIAHVLHGLGVPTLPRIMGEYAHSTTGIDIHPGAAIGLYFFIDHGTGVVIGETTQIGDRVRLYQGVTLGAASLRDGPSLRGRKRHPTVEDDVTIYAGATILGGETVIGKGSVIGGNVWITKSIQAGSHVIAEPPHHAVRGEDPAESEQLKWDL
ncbi:MAG: serine acetyltransferase [bacterium]|nr:serine acetyltransferase [bacterium]